MEHYYNHPKIDLPKLPEMLFHEMLILCIKEYIFLSPDEILYKQTDRIAMGSPLGTSFVDFYMRHLEKIIK